MLYLVRFIRIVVSPVIIIIHPSAIDNIPELINTLRKIGGSISTSKTVLITTFQIYLTPEICVRI